MKNINLIKDPPVECGGLLCGSKDLDYRKPLPHLTFDLRKADKYIKENNLPEITDEIKEMFRK